MTNETRVRITDVGRANMKRKLDDYMLAVPLMTPFPIQYTGAEDAMLSLVQDPRVSQWIRLANEIPTLREAVRWEYKTRLSLGAESQHIITITSLLPVLPYGPTTRRTRLLRVAPDHERIEEITYWARVAYANAEARRACKSFFTSVLDACSTPGQLDLVAPDLANMLGATLRRSDTPQVRQSRWPRTPKGVDIVSGLAQHSAFLARCMLVHAIDHEDPPYSIALTY